MGAGRHLREDEVLIANSAVFRGGVTRLAHQQADPGEPGIGALQFPEPADLHDRATRSSDANFLLHLLLDIARRHCRLAAARRARKNPAQFPGRAHFVSFNFPNTLNRGVESSKMDRG
jgi:hypothetical protein